MSGHSKWHSIKHKKAATDAKRGKIFTKHAKLITIAARDGGGDPVMNPSLRSAIDNAKADNTPNTNIEKAIKKGTGEDKDGANFDEIMYEGFGPCGTAMYVQVITDNKNRSVANVKIAFQKNGGNMGAAGSVGWKFEKKGVIMCELGGKDAEEAELVAIDCGAQDLDISEDMMEVLTDPVELMQVRDALEKAGFKVAKAEFDFRAKDPVGINALEDAQRIFKLIEALEDDEDVANVYGDFDIAEEVLNQME